MPKQLKEFPAAKKHNTKWPQWLDGKVYQFKQGEDYTNGESFRQCAYLAAKRHGKMLRAIKTADTVTIQAYDPEEQK